MKFTVGGAERRARSTSSYVHQMTQANFACTVTAADFDADGIAVPANSIVGSGWTTSGFAFVNRNHRALSNQSAHKVVGSAASISGTSPSPLTEANLNGAIVTVALTAATFRSGALPSHFEPVTTIPEKPLCDSFAML